jgi:hypothetical protein
MTEDQLIRDGYKFLGSGKCRECGEDIAWFETSKNKKKIPLDEGTLQPHWETCTK